MSTQHRRAMRLVLTLVLILGSSPHLSPSPLANADPRGDRPPAGRSLFDKVFTPQETGATTVRPPYPFSALLARLEQLAGSDGAGTSNVKVVLIPYGRSLQRHAGGEGRARRPRIVVAVDGVASTAPDHPRLYLKDRLFLGYHPDTATIEVISFNPLAGRFEFQVVRDYGPGTRPRVGYASRRLCTTCHHDEGPIFAEDSWDETMANEAMVNGMNPLAPPYERAWLNNPTAGAAAFDNATDRGALLPLYARLWNQLCESPQLTATLRCRAGAFTEMLRQRMGPFVFFTPRSRLFLSAFKPTAKARWRSAYPDGLPVPNPNLTNRDPLSGPNRSHVDAEDDPLLPRPSPPSWRLPGALNRTILGWAESLPDTDLETLDRALRDGAAPTALSQWFRGPCERWARGRIICHLVAAESAERLVVRFRSGHNQPRSPGVESVTGPDGTQFYAVEMEPGPDRDTHLLRQRGRGLSLRLGDGRRLGPIKLALDRTGRLRSASAPLIADFSAIETAVEQTVKDALHAVDHPLRGGTGDFRALLAEVSRTLGAPSTDWCCRVADAQQPQTNARNIPPRQDLWTRHCGGCHDQPGAHPPRFLVPQHHETAKRLSACAPLILARLNLWRQPLDTWTTSAMPPWRTIAHKGIPPETWAAHPDFEALQREAKRLALMPPAGGNFSGCRFPAH